MKIPSSIDIKKFALVIGCKDYAWSGIPSREHALNDIEYTRSFLKRYLQFDDSNIKCLQNPSRKQILEAVAWIKEQREAQQQSRSVMWVHIYGRGVGLQSEGVSITADILDALAPKSEKQFLVASIDTDRHLPESFKLNTNPSSRTQEFIQSRVSVSTSSAPGVASAPANQVVMYAAKPGTALPQPNNEKNSLARAMADKVKNIADTSPLIAVDELLRKARDYLVGKQQDVDIVGRIDLVLDAVKPLSSSLSSRSAVSSMLAASQRLPYHFVFVCDSSGSMSATDVVPSLAQLRNDKTLSHLQNRLGSVLEAIHHFIDIQIDRAKSNNFSTANDVFSICAFASSASTLANRKPLSERNDIFKAPITNVKASGNTRFIEGLNEAKKVIEDRSKNLNEQYKVVIVFLSDGENTDDTQQVLDTATHLMESFKAPNNSAVKSIRLYTVGFNTKKELEVLKTIAVIGYADCIPAGNDLQKLRQVFEFISDSVSQYRSVRI